MNFNLAKSVEILERTPAVLNSMLQDVSAEWTFTNEGEGTWSVFDILGHLIHGEKTDWIPRMEIILSDEPSKLFEPFDRLGQFEDSKGKSMAQLLDKFKNLRHENIAHLISKKLTEEDGEKTGVHPAFGKVSLAQLLSTWTVSDLNHIAQISRVMAIQYRDAIGPWIEYLGIFPIKKSTHN